MSNSLTPVFDEWQKALQTFHGYAPGRMYTRPDDPYFWYYAPKLNKPGFNAIQVILEELKAVPYLEILQTPYPIKVRMPKMTNKGMEFELMEIPCYLKYKDIGFALGRCDAGSHMITAFKYAELLSNQYKMKNNTKNKNTKAKMTRKEQRQKWYNLANSMSKI